MAMNRMQSLVSGTARRQSGNLTGRIVRMAWAPSVLSHPRHPQSVECPVVGPDAILARAIRAGRLAEFEGVLRSRFSAALLFQTTSYPAQVKANKRQKPCRKPVGKAAVLARA